MIHRKKVSNRLKWRLAKRQGYKCALSGLELDELFDVDHIVPLSHGGADNLNNMQLLNLQVHRIKTTMEAVARNQKRKELFCDCCGIYFSKYFIRNHLHL